MNGSKTASTPPNPNPAAEFKDAANRWLGSKGTPCLAESRSLFDTATDRADAVEQPAEDEETTATTAASERIRKFLSRLKARRFENYHDHRNHGSRISLR